MLKRDITYTNYDDEEVTETFYFNLSKPELMKLEVSYPDGLAKTMIAMLRNGDNAGMFLVLEKLLLASYGEKSVDGKRFVKSPELSEAFSQTEAYNVMFMEMLEDDNAAAAFLNGVVPKDMSAQMNNEELKKKAAEMIGNVKTVRDPTAIPVTEAAQQASQE